jgi:hypothetical protein
MSRIFPLPGVDDPPMRRPPGLTIILERLTELGDDSPPSIKRLLNDFRNAFGQFFDVNSRPPTWDELSREVMQAELNALHAEIAALKN